MMPFLVELVHSMGEVASAAGLKPVSSILLWKGLPANNRLEEASRGIEPRLLLTQALSCKAQHLPS